MRIFQSLACLVFAVALPASAQFFTLSTPTAPYTGNTTVVPVVGADASTTSSLSGGGQTLTFSSPMFVFTVPLGGWALWNTPPAVESGTPRVLATPAT